MSVSVLKLQQHGDARGMLVVAEYVKNIPFIVKSVNCIYSTINDAKDAINKLLLKSDVVIIPVKGACEIKFGGDHKENFNLNSYSDAIYATTGTLFQDIKLSDDTILLVLSA